MAVKNQRPQRRGGVPRRRGYTLHNGLEQLVHPRAPPGGNEQGVFRVKAQVFFNLLFRTGHVGGLHVDLVDHRHNFKVVLQREVHVGQGLRLHPLRGVHQQQRPFAGTDRPAHLVGKVHVSGRINQVEPVFAAVRGGIGNRHRLAFDRDAPLPLNIHGVQYLILKVAVFHQARFLDKPVGQRGLAVIDVGDNTKIADKSGLCHWEQYR